MVFANTTVYIPDEKGDLIGADAAIELAQNAMQEAPPGDFGAAFAKMILTLIALVALLAITFWFVRRLIQQRLQKGTGEQTIQIIEKKMISPKTMLYVVEIENQKILIAESHLEIRKIHNFTETTPN